MATLRVHTPKWKLALMSFSHQWNLSPTRNPKTTPLALDPKP